MDRPWPNIAVAYGKGPGSHENKHGLEIPIEVSEIVGWSKSDGTKAMVKVRFNEGILRTGRARVLEGWKVNGEPLSVWADKILSEDHGRWRVKWKNVWVEYDDKSTQCRDICANFLLDLSEVNAEFAVRQDDSDGHKHMLWSGREWVRGVHDDDGTVVIQVFDCEKMEE